MSRRMELRRWKTSSFLHQLCEHEGRRHNSKAKGHKARWAQRRAILVAATAALLPYLLQPANSERLLVFIPIAMPCFGHELEDDPEISAPFGPLNCAPYHRVR